MNALRTAVRLHRPLLALLASAAPALAQAERVQDLVGRGRAHLDAGRNHRALELFLQADAETHGALATRVWVLRTWMAQGRLNDAFDQTDVLARTHEGADLAYLYGIGSHLKALSYLRQAVPSATTGFAFQDAQDFLGTALESDPERYYDAWHPLAESAWFNQDLDAASAAIVHVLEREALKPAVLYLSGRIHFSQYTAAKTRNQAEEVALAHLEGAIEVLRAARSSIEDPKAQATLTADVLKELGIALQWQGSTGDAHQAYAEALGWNPNVLAFSDYWGTLGLDDFVQVLEAGARNFVEHWGTDTELDATLLWWLGSGQFTAESYVDSEATFGKVLTKWPAYVNSWFYVGMSRYYGTDYDGAIQAFHENWKVDPADLVASIQSNRELHLKVLDFLVGECAKRGQPPGTEPEYNARASFVCEVRCGVFPENWEYWDNWGFFARHAGIFLEERANPGDAQWTVRLFEQSWESYNRAIELSPAMPHLRNDAAVILHYHLKRDLDQALEMYRAALAMAEEQLGRGGLRPDLRTRAVEARADARANIAALEKDGRGL